MVSLLDAVLAKDVELDESGIKSISYQIIDREELVLGDVLPLLFKVWLVFKFQGPPDSTVNATIEVLSVMGRITSFDSGSMRVPASGKGDCPIEVTIPVEEVGPYKVLLLFDGKEVWRRTLFFARR